MNAIPDVTVSRSDGGWLAACVCGWACWKTYRAACDVAALDHHREWHE